MMLKRFLVALAIWLHLAPAHAFDRDPLDYSIGQYGFLLGIAVLGGLVSWYAKVKAGAVQAYNVMHLVGELTTSAFAGLIAFWLCESAGLPKLVTISLVAISGHAGTRAIAWFEEFAQRKWGVVTAPDAAADEPKG